MLIRPSGRNSPVASDSSLPSRAAIAAPSRPTHIVRLNAKGPAPGMPTPKILRTTISARGSSMTPPIAIIATRLPARTASNLLPLQPADRVPLRQRQVVDVGRDHAAAHRRLELFALGAEIVRGLGIEMRHREPAIGHVLDRLGILRRRGCHDA